MSRYGIVILLLVTVFAMVSCQENGAYEPLFRAGPPLPAFRAHSVALQSSFTRFRFDAAAAPQQWLDAYVKVLDDFDDPMKALGQFRFEIFRYRPQVADPRGPRFAEDGLQEFELTTLEGNQAHWDAITQSYQFRLALPEEAYELNDVVVEVTFRGHDDSRLGDFLILHRN
ncbi:MAG: hypothetical protein JW936_04190 [Sedimentisphaerales bacterium]|nr:hypothetical protein [Sedimentisphaerales bacterium]